MTTATKQRQPARPRCKGVLNLDDRDRKQKLLTWIGTLRGQYEVEVVPRMPRRSLKANSFWWGAVVPAFQTFMRGHGQYFEKEEVHEFFLQKFASREVIDPDTGEVLSIIGRRSSKMDGPDFGAFVNACIEWMYDRFSIVIPDAEEFKQKAETAA